MGKRNKIIQIPISFFEFLNINKAGAVKKLKTIKFNE